MVLPRLTVLDRRYAIGGVLDDPDAFSISYKAWNLKTEDPVVVLEYFPNNLVRRAEDGLHVITRDSLQGELYHYGQELFLKEAEMLGALDHPSLVRELEWFEDHNTIYRVLEHHTGAPLQAVLDKHGGRLNGKTAITLLMPVMEGLQVAHQQGLVHGAITPAAIFLSKGSGPLVRGFGTAALMFALRTGEVEGLIVPGFSAPEQYDVEGKSGPWTDVYGCAATLFHILTGKMLPEAAKRMEQDDVPELLYDAEGLWDDLPSLLEEALALDAGERPRTIKNFQEELYASFTGERIVVPAGEADEEEEAVAEHEDAVAEPQEAAPEPVEAEAAGADEPEATTEDDAVAFDEAPAAEEAYTEEPVAFEAIEEPAAERDDAFVAAEAEGASEAVEAEEVSEEAYAEDLADTEAAVIDVEADTAPEDDAYAETPEEAHTFDAADAEAEYTVASDTAEEYSLEEDIVYASDATDDTEALVAEVEDESAPAEADVLPAEAEEDAAPAEVEPEPVVVAETSDEPASPEPPKEPARQPLRRDRTALRNARKDRLAVPSHRKRLPVWAALAAVVIVALAGAYVVMQDEDSGVAQYAYFRSQGDSLFALADYAAAKAEYEHALSRVPDDEYVATRLQEAEQLLAGVSSERYAEHVVLGDSLFDMADELLAAGDAFESLTYYAEANKAYFEALAYQPNDPDLLEKGQLTREAMNRALQLSRAQGAPVEDEVDPQEEREQRYTNYRQQGDVFFADEAYEDARRKYIEALEFMPGDAYVTGKLQEINTFLSEAERDEQYQRHMQRGIALCEQGRCGEASVEFQQALQLKPNDVQARAGLDRAEQALAVEQRNNQQYQYHRGQGDALAAQRDYAGALASYQKALEFRPGDTYVQQQIASARQAQNQQPGPEEQPASTITVDENGVHLVVEEAPVLIGGLVGLHEKVRVPKSAIDAGVSGRVFVQFIINERGRVEDAEVIRGIGGGCDEEAVRVIRQARFEPGKMSGQPVKMRHTLFIKFPEVQRNDE